MPRVNFRAGDGDFRMVRAACGERSGCFRGKTLWVIRVGRLLEGVTLISGQVVQSIYFGRVFKQELSCD